MQLLQLLQCLLSWRSPTALESSLVYTYERWVFAMCPALPGSTVSYAGVAHVSKNCFEFSINSWSWSKKKISLLSVPNYHLQVDRPR